MLMLNMLFTKGPKTFLERVANHLEINNSLSWKVLEPLRKSLEFTGNFYFMPKEALSGFWNHPEELRNLWNIPEYMILAYILHILS